MERLKSEYQVFRTGLDSLGTVSKLRERNIQSGDKLFISIKSESLIEQYVNLFDDGASIEYPLDDDGFINMPLIGKIKVLGLARTEVEKIVKSKLAPFIKDPFVSIKPLTIQIKVIGQVDKQNVIVLPENEANLVTVLANVGGLQNYARRDSILVIREQNGNRQLINVDLRDANKFFNSPAFQLQNNDVVVVQANDYFFKNYRNQEIATNMGRITPYLAILGILFIIIPVIQLLR